MSQDQPFRPTRAWILGAGAAAVAAATVPARAQSGVKLRIGAVPYDVGASPFYAYDQGIFTKHGLDVTVSVGSSGASIAAAVAGGSLDMGASNTVSLAQAYLNGVPFVLMAPSGAYTSASPTGAFVVSANSPVKAPRDLLGKTIGVTLRSIAEVTTRAWLERNGISGDSVKYIDVPLPQVPEGIASGRLDGGSLEEPFLSAFLQNGGRVLAYSYNAIAPTWVEGGYFATRDFALKNADVVKRFADAMAETAAWANANHDATAKILERYAGAPTPAKMARMYYPPRLVAAQIQPLIDAGAKYNVLKSAFPARNLFAPGLS